MIHSKMVVNLSPMEQVKKEMAKDIWLVVLCIFISRTSILEGLAPFGIAFYASVLLAGGSILAPLLGCVAGTVSLGTTAAIFDSFAYFMLYGMVFYIKKKKGKIRKLTISLAVVISMAVVKLLYALFYSMLLYETLMAGLEILISLLMIYIFSNTVKILYQHKKRRILSNEEMICLSVFLAICIMGIGDIHIGQYSIANVLSILTILLFAYIGGAGVGASIGITLGIILSLGTKMDPYLIGNLGVCGLMAGTFRELKKVGTIGGFILANAIITFYINKSTVVIIPFPEIIAAAVILLLFPKKVIQYFQQFADSSFRRQGDENYYIHRLRDLTVNRLKEFSTVFQQMSGVFGRIAKEQKRLGQEDISDLLDIVASRVCVRCALKQSCWKREFYSTYNGLFDLLAVVEKKGYIEREDIPAPIARKCIHIETLLSVLNDIFDQYRINLQWQKKIEESRLLVGEQLNGVSQVISELAAEINMDVRFKEDLEQAIREELDQAGIHVKEVVVQESRNGKMEIHIVRKPCGGKRQCVTPMSKIISRTVGKKMSVEDGICHSYGKPQCLLIFREVLAFHVTTGVARRAKNNHDICGDSYSFQGLKEGKYLLALSDGMGTGSRAADESAATISLLEHFYEAGFQEDVIFRTVNSVLMLRSNEEIFATVDLCILDLIEGYGDFIKIGAVSTYIKKGERVEGIRSANLPIGILEDIQPESIRRPIHGGDFIIMLTDGVMDAIGPIEEQDDWMAGILGEIQTQSPQEMADIILDKALEYSEGSPKDDMTVMVTRIWGDEKH